MLNHPILSLGVSTGIKQNLAILGTCFLIALFVWISNKKPKKD